jgi:Domain of unknown function (DUF5666)
MQKSILFTAVFVALGSSFSVHAASSPPDMTVVEYFHRGTAHYFMTGSAAEQRLLDSPALRGDFARSGRTFSAWSPQAADRPADAVAVMRFFQPKVASHVYTSHAVDIAALRAYPQKADGTGFSDEGIAFFAMQAIDQRCATGTKAIYRSYNNRPDGNHRYSNEIELHASMTKLGFVDERTAFCAPTISIDLTAEAKAGTPRATSENSKISGVVSAFVSLSNFMLGTQKVDASNARFEHGASGALANGVAVRVEGVVINGVLVATEVKLPEGATSMVDEIKGFVTAIGSGGNLFVNGVAVDASKAVLTGGTLAQLVIGVEVEVNGNFVNGVFVATTLHIEDRFAPGTPPSGTPPTAGLAEIEGLVGNFVSASNFTVNGQKIDASNAVFEDGTAASLANGVVVEVHGTVTNGVLIATRVEIKNDDNDNDDNPAAGLAEILGTVSGFVSASNFTVNGQKVDATNAVFKDGSAASLANGVLVEVKGNVVNGVLIATRVEIKGSPSGTTPTPGAEFEAKGTISAFVSVASFLVGGSTIDATNASFERGTAADLRNGVLVEVKGVVVGGVVKATRVRFER